MPDQDLPHFHIVTNGTNRYERELAALAPANVSIDGYEVIDRMFYALQMSQSFKYFDLSNHDGKTWSDLLIQNKYFRFAYVYKYDYSKKIDQHIARLTLAENTTKVGEKTLKEYLDEVINDVDELNCELTRWAEKWFDINVDSQFKTFNSLIVVAQKETKGIIDILKKIRTAKIADIEFEINDSVTKVKRYFNDVTQSAKEEFDKQRLADNAIDSHISLFLGFLQLFDAQKNKLNGLTARHLDYCYGQLLGLKNNKAQADSVYVAFALAKGVTSYTVPAGTQLNAGKDENSLPVIFTTDKELVVNNIAVADFKTLFINHFNPFTDKAGYTPDMLLKAKKGGQLLQAVMKMTAFDGSGGVNSSTGVAAGVALSSGSQNTYTDENLGLVIASSMFYIEDGQAEIVLTLDFTTTDKLYNSNLNEIGGAPFAISVTTAQGWFKIDSYTFSPGSKSIALKWKYDASVLPIVSYNATVYPEKYALKKPAVKLELQRRSGDDLSPYIYLQNLIVKNVRIEVSATRNKKVRIQTTAGGVGPGNPFQAFGPIPKPGSYFDLRNANIFNKNLGSFKVNLEWLGLPVLPGGFDTYYTKYNADPFNAGLTNSAFKVNVETLNGGDFEAVGTNNRDFPLFSVENNVLKNSTAIEIKGGSRILGFNNIASLENEKQQDFSMAGLIRISLTSPTAGFGADLFPSVLSYTIISNNNNNKNTPLKAPKTKTPWFTNKIAGAKALAPPPSPQILPNQPFIPVIKTVSINYDLSYSEVLENSKINPDSDITVIHTNPFGYKTIYPNEPGNDDCYLMPRFISGNNLFIGLTDVGRDAQVNLLFTLNENVIENDFAELAPFNWYYLKNNEWVLFDDDDISSDSTADFTKNGIVKLNLPNDITTDNDFDNNTLMPPNMAWLLATVQEDDFDDPTLRNLSTMVYSITNNAVSVTRLINDASATSGPLTLGAGTISELMVRQPKIAAITQPLPSFGGVQAETGDTFYSRVSERLRHKSRPLSAWELERTVLDKFPQIRYVKCINLKASRWDMPNMTPEPDILVIVVGDVFYQAKGDTTGNNNNIRVSYSQLADIKAYLLSVLNAKLEIAVTNPHLERLRIKCAITFKDNDFSKEKDLERDFANYLTPWLFNPDRKIKVNSTIYRSDILGFIRSRPYVERVKNLVLVHLFEKSLIKIVGNVPEQAATEATDERMDYFLEEVADDRPLRTVLPYGVFSADAPHYLSTISKKTKDEVQFMGITDMTINDDFRIGTKKTDETDNPPNKFVNPERISFTINI